MVPQVDTETVRALSAINTAFYARHADAFSASREGPWPGWGRVLDHVEALAASPLAVLDVACGNGRFGALLLRRGLPLDYVGVDASERLLEHARARLARPSRAFELLRADLTAAPPDTALPQGPFDLIAVFGLLHHLPGAALRERLLAALAARLRPGGLLVLAAWRLAAFARFEARRVDWEAYNLRAPRPVDTRQLEPGDALLTWGGDPQALRYVHFADDAEIERTVRALPLDTLDTWCADGREGATNRYFVLRHRA